MILLAITMFWGTKNPMAKFRNCNITNNLAAQIFFAGFKHFPMNYIIILTSGTFLWLYSCFWGQGIEW